MLSGQKVDTSQEVNHSTCLVLRGGPLAEAAEETVAVALGDVLVVLCVPHQQRSPRMQLTPDISEPVVIDVLWGISRD